MIVTTNNLVNWPNSGMSDALRRLGMAIQQASHRRREAVVLPDKRPADRMSNKHGVAILAQIAHFVRIHSAAGGDNEAAARRRLLNNSFGAWRNEAVREKDNLPLCPVEARVDNVACPEVGVLDFGVGEISSVQAGTLERLRVHNTATLKVSRSKLGIGEITFVKD